MTNSGTPGEPGLRRIRVLLAAGAIGLLSMGCAGGTGAEGLASSAPPPPGGGGGGGGGTGGTGGSQAAPTAVGTTYGELEVELPNATSFLLHGTLPLVAGTYPRVDHQNPFAILDYDGTAKACQVEIVSKYSSLQRHGADVVELIAQVRRDPALPPGTRTTYEVVVGYTPETVAPASASVNDLITGPVNVMNSVVGLLQNPASIEIATRDVFGHRYSMRPLEAQGGIETRRYGDLHSQVRTYGTLLPDSPVSGTSGTLPHLMGVHSYISSLSNEQVVLLDVRFNNGADGDDPTDSIDDANKQVYWDSLDIIVPTGWVVLSAFDNPFWGNVNPIHAAGRTTYKLVEPLPGNKLHVMPEQGQFHRRLALCPAGVEPRARFILEQEGLGFCIRGRNSDGEPYFSWWNTSTARYFPQAFLLPSLEHIGDSSVRATLNSELNTLVNRVASGTGTGSYPVQSDVLGWAHPFGVQYGGMTGGDEIFLWQGVRTAEVAEVAGYRKLQLHHRMHTDRQPNVLYGKDGEPTRLEDWLKGSGSNQYIDFDFYMKPIGSKDPFGYKSAPQFQVTAASSQNRTPPYQSNILGYEAHDEQHLVRYLHAPLTLAWLGNDALAKDDIEMQAELVELSYHMYANNSGGHAQQTGMLWDRQYVDGNPGAGFRFGRGEGWAIHAMNAAYRTGDEAFRADKKPWYDDLRDLVVDGQANCSGFLQSNISPKFLNGLYRARQNVEQAILENAIRGVVQSVYILEDPASVAMLDNVLEKSYYSWFSIMSWSSSHNGPWAKAAVGPLDENLPPWCNFLPASGGTTTWVDTYQLWSSMAYGNWATNDPIFLQRSLDMLGPGGMLLTKLENQGDNNIFNRAALLALVQLQNGIL